MSAGEDGRHVVGFLNLVIDVFLEVQNERYIKISYLTDYIVYGLHLWYKIQMLKNKSADNVAKTSWLRQQSVHYARIRFLLSDFT